MWKRLRLATLLLVALTSLGCRVLSDWSTERSLEQTRVAEEYPYAVYPISEESKAKLCQALALPQDDEFCQPETEVTHWDVADKIEEMFPAGKTQYSEVEAKLGSFPHVLQAPKNESGALISLRYVYGLTEYEGACVSFYIDLNDQSTVTRIGVTTPGESGSGSNQTICAPFRGSGHNQ